MINLCLCMGPQGNDPVCPCEMRQQGLEPNNSWTPEKIEEFKEALGKIYNWEKEEDVNSLFKK